MNPDPTDRGGKSRAAGILSLDFGPPPTRGIGRFLPAPLLFGARVTKRITFRVARALRWQARIHGIRAYRAATRAARIAVGRIMRALPGKVHLRIKRRRAAAARRVSPVPPRRWNFLRSATEVGSKLRIFAKAKAIWILRTALRALHVTTDPAALSGSQLWLLLGDVAAWQARRAVGSCRQAAFRIRPGAPNPRVWFVSLSGQLKDVAGAFRAWFAETQRAEGGDIQVINFHWELAQELANSVPVRFPRELVSAAEEYDLWTRAYAMSNHLLQRLEGISASWGEVFAEASVHDIARQAYDVACMLHIASHERYRGRCKVNLTLTQIWDTALISALPAGWRYVHLGERRPFLPVADANFGRAAVQRDIDNYDGYARRLGRHNPDWRSADAPPISDAPVLLVTSDSGSGLNLIPAVAVARALTCRGQPPIVLMSTAKLADKFAGVAQEVFVVPVGGPGYRPAMMQEVSGIAIAMIRECTRMAFRERDQGMRLFLLGIRNRLHTYMRRVAQYRGAIESALNNYDPAVVVNVGESVSLCAAASVLARARGTPDIGVSSVLRGDWPESTRLPASRHLVYGDQLVELMVRNGAAPEAIEVVGSPNFDAGLSRDTAADRALVAKLLPGATGRRLVVVATEARPGQLEEIGAIVRALLPIEGLFIAVKLHPSDREEVFQPLVQSLGQAVKVALIKNCDIQALFSVCELVVCQRSNVIVEAAVRGVPCIACNFTGDETIVLDFVAEGLCVGAESPEEFSRIAADALAGGKMWDEMKRRLATVSRFNGPNDGRSAERIADRVLSLRETAT